MRIIADKNIPFVEEAFSEFGDVVALPGRDILQDEVRDADILLVRTVTPVDEALLRRSRVQFVGTATIGYDHVDVEYLNSRDIVFSSAAGCNSNSVAEYVIAGLLVLAERYELDLSNMTLGVVGVGNVGSKVVEKAKALGMKVLLNDPPRARELDGPGRRGYLPLKRVLDESDIVTLHVPLTYEGEDATYRMAHPGFFNKMREGSFLINTSRGQVVDTYALLHALYHGRVKSAVIDVWEGEPAIPVTLLDCIDIGTPHIAGYSRDGKANATRLLYESATRHFSKPLNWFPGKLPEPCVPVIHVTKNGADVQSILGSIVKKAYNIRRDDRALRMMITHPPRTRPEYFECLRNEYPVRREFHSMTVCISEDKKHIVPAVKILGFKLNKNNKHTINKGKRKRDTNYE